MYRSGLSLRQSTSNYCIPLAKASAIQSNDEAECEMCQFVHNKQGNSRQN